MPLSGGGFLDITFEVTGQEPIQRKLATFGARISDLSPAWEQVGTALLQDFAQNFADEGGVFGKGAWAQWQPLAESTVRERIRLKIPGEHPILVRTGDLMTSTTVRGAPNNVFELSPNSLVLGTTDHKAGWHQFGTRTMPARKIVGISAQRAGYSGREGSIVGIVDQWVKQQIREQGLG